MRRFAIQTRHMTLFGAVATGIAAFAIGSSHAQNALGGGNRLDANLGFGTGRVNLPRPVEDFRARNLVVTGNVAGGRGFRGAVGYGAEADFRDVTGVDDLFDFRAGAAFSAPQLFTTPGWQQLRFGQDLGAAALRRGDGGATAGMVTLPHQFDRHDEFRTQRPVDDRLRLDAILAYGATTARLDVPTPDRPIGLALAEEGRLFTFEVSPLRGVTAVAAAEREARLGLSPYDVARLRSERPMASPPNMVEQDRLPFTALLDSGRVQPGTADVPLQLMAEEPVTGILDRIARRYADRQDVLVHLDPRMLEQLDDQYQDLRERLMRLSPAERWRRDAELAAGEALVVLPEDDDEWRPVTRPVVPGPQPGVADRTDEDELEPRPAPGEVIPPGHLDMLFDALRHGERVERLATEGNSRFDELMAEGERFLLAGEFFDAERRFLRALRILPGHPLAMVGAAHAQLGAGLQLPAALSIRRLLSGHPELIDVRYEARLLPSRPRLIEVVDAAEARLERVPGDEAEYGLVIAYVGHQIADRTQIERGLSLMQQAAPDDPFLTVLRNVWLAPPQQTPEK